MSRDNQYQILAFARTDVGRVRSANEDSLVVSNLSEGIRIEQSGYLRFASNSSGALFAVADGMGGAAAGETASRVCLRTLYHEVQDSAHRHRLGSDRVMERILIDAVGNANRRVYDMARRDPLLSGMGTTLTVVLQAYDRMVIGQIGDSRAYHLRESGIRQLTRDQSLVAQMVSAGKLTEEEARRHPEKNVLLQAIGVRPQVELALRSASLEPGDILLLCSDGLHTQMSSDEIFDVVWDSSGPDDACTALVDLANRRGGPDNITAVLVQFIPE
jgi:serine/threonine protein phosphatase PrpC